MTRPALVVASVALLMLASCPDDAHAQGRETPLAEGRRTLSVQSERYGTLADDHPTTLHVRAVFERIVRAAGRRPGVAFEVHVLDTPRIIAEALVGGLVVVSRGFVDLAQNDVNALAFVLAHEVAHLVRDHHGMLDSLGMLGTRVAGTPPSPDQVRAYHGVELEADRLGVLFAALAGYDVAAAVPMLFTLTARAGPDAFHPNPLDRAERMRAEILDISEHVEIFRLGLYLLTSGRYLESARVLEHFLGLFPSREVLSAVGLGYHREALRWLPTPEFRHVLVVDAITRAPASRSGRRPPRFMAMMERALHYYSLAVAADPEYAPAFANLAAAQIDLGDPKLAIGYASRALREDPQLASAYVNRAIAWTVEKDYRRAEEDLLAAAKLAPAMREVAWNLSRIYEREGRTDDARRWAARAAEPAPVRDGAPRLPPGLDDRVREAISDRRAHHIRIPVGGRGTDDLTLVIERVRGLAGVLRHGNLDAAAILASPRAMALGGVRPGHLASRVETLWGRPSALDGFQAISVWSYPARTAAAFVVRDRLHSVWIGLGAPRPDEGRPSAGWGVRPADTERKALP